MKYTVTEKDVGVRLDVFVSESTSLSRSAAAKLIENRSITVFGKASTKKYEVRCGDEVEVNLPEPESSEALPENIPLDIVYEDNDIIVINGVQYERYSSDPSVRDYQQ